MYSVAIPLTNHIATTYATGWRSYYAEPDLAGYLVNRADDLFKIKRVVEYCDNNHLMPVTELLKSKEFDHKRFRGRWEHFRQGFLRKYEVMTIGTMERGPKGEGCGMLHGHLLMVFPERYARDAVFGQIAAELRECWMAINERAGGRLKGGRMALIRPYDHTGEKFGPYISKAFVRGNTLAKWGQERNQSFLLKSNLPRPALWRRDELPSRGSRRKAIQWLAAELMPSHRGAGQGGG